MIAPTSGSIVVSSGAMRGDGAIDSVVDGLAVLEMLISGCPEESNSSSHPRTSLIRFSETESSALIR